MIFKEILNINTIFQRNLFINVADYAVGKGKAISVPQPVGLWRRGDFHIFCTIGSRMAMGLSALRTGRP
jgi:hypothetical protein